MRQVFHTYEENLAAIMLVGIKQDSENNLSTDKGGT